MKVAVAFAVIALAIIGCSSTSLPLKDNSGLLDITKILTTIPKDVILSELKKMLDPNARGSMDDSLKKFLESLKEKFPVGMPEYGIPPLDPFFVEKFDFDIQQDFAVLKGSLKNGNITQLAQFSIDYTKINVFGLSVAVNFSIPEILAKGHYNIDGEIVNLLPVYGEGDFRLAVKGFNASVLIKAGTKDGFVFVKALDLTFSLDGLETHFEGLLGGGDQGELANELISDIAPDVLNAYSPDISHIVSGKIIEIANTALTNVTLSDLIGMITG